MTKNVKYKPIFDRTGPKILICVPFLGKIPPIQGNLRTQYILFSPDRPTLQNRGWTGNRDITSSRLTRDETASGSHQKFG
jgi:hypothetical protein